MPSAAPWMRSLKIPRKYANTCIGMRPDNTLTSAMEGALLQRIVADFWIGQARPASGRRRNAIDESWVDAGDHGLYVARTGESEGP